ncbi:thiaminase II [Algihabitans albus]|uniref:thiaminase II n=1 Tax=Algihabitans albus TaxID=2164067 RepID=UPI000E5D2812|nr:thiaminase II [Algihabitans albus]
MSSNPSVYETLKSAATASWEGYIGHPFVRQLARGELPEACFRHYLGQDYLFLLHYSRAWALAVVKSQDVEDLRQSAAAVDLLLNHELALHVTYCERWGLREADLVRLPEADANRLYTRFVMDTGLSGDLLDLLVALSPCSLGYAEIGRRLAADPATRLEGNPYRDWIEMYGGSEFQEGAELCRQQLERVARARGLTGDLTANPRWPALRQLFETACRLEIGFWDMGLLGA